MQIFQIAMPFRLKCQSGFSLVAVALMLNALLFINGTVSLLLSGQNQKIFTSQLRSAHLEQANKNSAVVTDILIGSNLVVRNSSTGVWSASSTAVSNSLWAFSSGNLVFGLCDPLQNKALFSNGTPASISTCIKLHPRGVFSSFTNSAVKIFFSTTSANVTRTLTALIPGPPVTALLITALLTLDRQHSDVVRCYHSRKKQPENSSVSIRWTSTNATSCSLKLADVIKGGPGINGTFTRSVLSLTANETYTLECTDGTTIATDSHTIQVARNTGLPAESSSGVYLHHYCYGEYEYIGGISTTNKKGYTSSIHFTEPLAKWKPWALIPGQSGTHDMSYNYIVDFGSATNYTATSKVSGSGCYAIDVSLSDGNFSFGSYYQVDCPADPGSYSCGHPSPN